MNSRRAAILVEHGKALLHAAADQVAFTNSPAADSLLNDLEHHPHAFVLGCVMDRQIKAERAWVIPYLVSEKLGDFSFRRLSALSLEQVRDLLTKPEPLHRFPEKMSLNFHAAVQRIADCYAGDASRIWRGEPPSAEVIFRFLGFRGIGPKIATMAANILARNFKVRFADYYSVDISVDVHVRRVFTRLGLVAEKSTVDEIIYCARALHPEFPGLLDFPAWEIGRTWCRPTTPCCGDCYMQPVCPTATEVRANAG